MKDDIPMDPENTRETLDLDEVADPAKKNPCTFMEPNTFTI